MIYILLYLLMVFMAFIYDVMGHRNNSNFFFRLILLILALLSGLRYRLGADTIVYEYYYNHTPDLFHLNWTFVRDNDFEPFWVLLNSLCRTIIPDFFLVQLCVSFFHIFTEGWFIKRIMPNCKFLMLVFFYMFEFTHLDMVLMREAISISFFMLAIISLNDGKILKVFLLLLLGAMFHKFSVMVFLFVIVGYVLYIKFPKLSVIMLAILTILFVTYIDIIQEQMARYIVDTDNIYTTKMTAYVMNEKTSQSTLNWKGYLSLYMSVLIYVIMLVIIKKKNTMPQIKHDLFVTLVIIAIVSATIRGVFPALYRIYDYFQTTTSSLAILFFMEYLKSNSLKKIKVIPFIIFISISTFFSYKIYFGTWGGNQSDGVYGYMEFYPYSSVLYPQKDDKREHSILNYAFD